MLAAALATAAGVLLISGDEENGGQPVSELPSPPPPARPPGRLSQHHPPSTHSPSRRRREVHQAVRESKAARLDPAQRRVARIVRAYVAGLDTRDGERVCGLFVPGALAGVRLPRDRGSCARSLSASIGFRDPRGFPVYRSSRIARIPAVAINGATARVTATTVTQFADNREPSVEDDIVYLQKHGAAWLIAKPSAALYRAIGVGDIPPQVLAPP
ncbi:MAG: hypothetical protein AUG48_08540 [Actinobacteria bacterium 13_1_20CM_3_68_9]|nr:MAG: hypothetical protein AUG48_08540 [Actinobacteria bacterium 13_1_20CM_3_68_9]